MRVAGQHVDKLHRAGVGWNDFGMRNLIIDNPFGRIGELIHDEDMAALYGGVLDVPDADEE